jgi:hypothetical protein
MHPSLSPSLPSSHSYLRPVMLWWTLVLFWFWLKINAVPFGKELGSSFSIIISDKILISYFLLKSWRAAKPSLYWFRNIFHNTSSIVMYTTVFQVQLHYQPLLSVSKCVWSTKSLEPILYYFQQPGLNTFTSLFFKILYFNQFCFR